MNQSGSGKNAQSLRQSGGVAIWLSQLDSEARDPSLRLKNGNAQDDITFVRIQTGSLETIRYQG
jgi:hypothetical protein